ncbi:hypothetical protein [Actinoplanes sp. NPDC023714]|uniref:hypothetical protein n=1 Tax=Actinoplanes sp. NPDC023714 TaxID=3154322 RepID=UPI0033D39BDD
MENDAAAQLAAITDARAAVADRLVTPWWYHPVLGLAAAGYVVGYSFGGTVVRLVTVVLFVGVAFALVSAYKRKTGVWVSGLNAGRASRWAIAMGVVLGVVAVAGLVVGMYTDLRWPVWCLAGVTFVATVLLGRRFDAALRAQLRAGA